MKLRYQRLRDFAIYFAAGVALVAGIGFLATYTAQREIDPHRVTRWIGPALETALVFGFVLYWYRRFLKTARLWIALAVLFCGHSIAIWSFAESAGPIPLIYWWVVAFVEQLGMAWVLDMLLRRGPISKL